MAQTVVRSKSTDAYQRLRDLIASGQIPAGERLTQAMAAKLTGIGRTPVRDSLQRLEAEGVVKREAGRYGHVVVYAEDFSPDELLHRFELRAAVVGLAAQLAADQMTGMQIKRLRELARTADKILRRKPVDHQAYGQIHGQLYEYLLLHCGNPLLLRVWQQFSLGPLVISRTRDWLELLRGTPELRAVVDQSAQDFVDSLASHDPQRARDFIERGMTAHARAWRRVMADSTLAISR